MKEKEIYKKTEKLISRFKNGQKRYRNSSLFNQVINSLARDADPIDIIDQLIDVTESSQGALQQQLLRTSARFDIRK